MQPQQFTFTIPQIDAATLNIILMVLLALSEYIGKSARFKSSGIIDLIINVLKSVLSARAGIVSLPNNLPNVTNEDTKPGVKPNATNVDNTVPNATNKTEPKKED